MKIIKSRVNAKVFVVTIPLLLAALILGAYLLSSYVVNAITAGYKANLRRELVTVEQALQQAFMNNDFLTVQEVVANLSYHSQIQGIRILDQKGNILAGSVPDEVGVHLDLNSQPCQSCHTGKNALAPAIQQVSVDYTGDKVIVTAKALENQVACQTCHSSDGATLGVIVAEHDLAPIETQVTDLTRGIYAGAGVVFLFLSGVFVFSFSRLVDRPLRSLASGETDPNLFTRQDEFGTLARKSQRLNTDVKEKGDQLDAQRRNFHALLSLAESIDVSLTAEKVLQFAIGKVQEVTGFTNIAMRLFDPKQKCFRLVAQNGMSPRMVEDLRSIPAEIGFTGDVYKTHRAAYTSDLSSDSRLESPAPVEFGIHSLVSVPFLSGDRLMGSMELASKEEHIWSEDEVRWLELMGRSIGNVLHHIETSDQLQGMAVIQERARIAQEIHDGLAQLIGTLRLWADEAQLALQEMDLPEVQKDLQKIELTARDAYGGLREEILGLRDTLLPGKEIVSVIREFLNRYQRQWGIETQLLVDQNQLDDDGRLSISPAAEIQLLRIIQEGLTNVRRHANASRVVVSMEDGEEHLRIEIRDNGQGFDTHNVPEEKLGLRIMRERAATVGGVVAVKSSIGEGTYLIVELPKQITPVKIPPETAGLEKEE
jgi:two-component system, NarL family, nitrate/nitrite sensor histidine kinase NarX